MNFLFILYSYRRPALIKTAMKAAIGLNCGKRKPRPFNCRNRHGRHDLDIGDPKRYSPHQQTGCRKKTGSRRVGKMFTIRLGCTAPHADAAQFEKDRAVLRFQFTGSGLVAKDKFGYLKG
ncbi:MAG: hypothetical protein IPL27_15035, partial [Lewinellaceae bacterium]|nr:hypothetical protein [Lewinellaceae bacterium]